VVGEIDKAFEWMNKAYEENSFSLLWLICDSEWDPIRSDPRFTEMLIKMNLPLD